MECKTPPGDLSFVFGFLDIEDGYTRCLVGRCGPPTNVRPLCSFVGFPDRAILQNGNIGIVVVIVVLDLVAVVEGLLKIHSILIAPTCISRIEGKNGLNWQRENVKSGNRNIATETDCDKPCSK